MLVPAWHLNKRGLMAELEADHMTISSHSMANTSKYRRTPTSSKLQICKFLNKKEKPMPLDTEPIILLCISLNLHERLQESQRCIMEGKLSQTITCYFLSKKKVWEGSGEASLSAV